MPILCLSHERFHWKLIPGYASAFGRVGIPFVYLEDSVPLDSPLAELVRSLPERPSYIFHFESAWPLLPQGLERSEIPTVCFQADTYAYTERRIRWSSLFDHVAVFHPAYVKVFQDAGHPGAFLLPHAVEKDFYDGPELSREFEIGWVGQTEGSVYRRRAEWLPKLRAEFRTNDMERHYSLREVADAYRRSRVVVNFSRDDFPQDANLRVFEVLASGALLITSLPNELTDLGFEDGVHFVGYAREEEILPLVRQYLNDEPARAAIGNRGRQKALAEHTYDHRVARLLAHLRSAGNQKLAPARRWPESRARLMALDFFSSHGAWECSKAQYRRIVGRGLAETVEGASLLAKAFVRQRREAGRRF